MPRARAIRSVSSWSAVALPSRAAAIEPQTHLPQGLGRLLRGEPGALELLAPAATLRLAMEWQFRR